MSQRNCLLCYRHCDGSTFKGPIGKLRAAGNSLLDQQVIVVFILRKLLDIPGSFYEGLCSENGNPYNWINCCQSCSNLISEAHEVVEKITVLDKKYESLKNQIRHVLDTSKGVQKAVVPNPHHHNAATDKIRQWALAGATSPLSLNAVHPDSDVAKLQQDIFVKCEPDEEIALRGESEIHVAVNGVEDSGLGQLEGDIFVKFEVGEEIEPESGFPHMNNYDDDKKEDDSFGYLDPHKGKERRGETQKPFPCSQCPKSFFISSSLKKHFNVHHTDDFQSRCHICGQSVPDPWKFKMHMQSHEEKIFNCEMCGAAYMDGLSLKRHQLEQHYKELGLTPLICGFCGKARATPSRLNSHIASHTKDHKFSCPHCDQKCSVKRDLEDHIRIRHTREKPFGCGICGQAFSTNRLFRLHNQKHTGFKFKCDICGKGLPSKYQLDQHLAKHNK